MKLASLLLLSLGLAASAIAGPVDYSKDSKAPVPPPPPAPACFGPGFALGGYAGGYLPRDTGYRKDGMGGGVLADYFFNDFVGISAQYGAFAPNPVHHLYEGDLVLRYPIQSACVAPYLLLGGGGIADSANFGFWDVGGGIEVRCPSMPHIGIFADGTYHFSGSNTEYREFTLVRVGLKYAF